MVELTKEQLDQMLEEVAGYEIKLEEDPTLPHLGTKYLQKALAQCRNFMNRVQHYLQLSMRAERALLTEIKQAELDLEFKVKDKLADDPIVRQQKSVEDRKALAESLLKAEVENLKTLRVKLIDIQESVKLLRFKYHDLQRTNGDIKMQRGLVRDDKLTQLGGGDGYSQPQVNPDRSVPNGMQAPVPVEPLGPKEILDPNRRPEDLPEPLDATHAAQISEFLRRNPEKAEPRYNGLMCPICGNPQFESPSGPACNNGHGGQEGVAPKSEPEPPVNTGPNVSYDELLT